MPIRAENRTRYPKDWKLISARIRQRAEYKCEQCGAPNGLFRNNATNQITADLNLVQVWEALECVKVTKIVLTVAHLNHRPEDCRDENLMALCQRCHLRYDHKQHVANARRTRDAKLGQLAFDV